MSKTFRVQVNGRNKLLSGRLPMDTPTTFTKTFGFPNSTDSGQAVIISLTYGDELLATYSYTPMSLSPQEEQELTTTGYYVSSVIDGDSFRIKYQGVTQTVRLIGIDAPENSLTRYRQLECFGLEAKLYLKNLIDKKKIRLQFDETQNQRDIYGRLLAYVYLESLFVNQDMIAQGYAKQYTFKTRYAYQDAFQQAEQSAQENQLGLWNERICGISLSGVQRSGDLEALATGNELVPTTGLWTGLLFTITYVLPNPVGKDSQEEIGIFLSNLHQSSGQQQSVSVDLSQ